MPINEKIRADEVMLIDDSGEKLGVVKIEEALDKAKAKNIDLVQVSPFGANPTAISEVIELPLSIIVVTISND